ncbi:phosphodiester glycosidase family protein [Paenibacillus sp. sgz500992]|uniref:phosphodiester glycosidase family protein n=1 Tax=Paenibacillus sp. sgz500992 TaxID=3242476 RepID=UPI0036D3A751
MQKHLRKFNPAIIFLLLLSMFQPGAMANAAIAELPASEYGTVMDMRKTELAPGAIYTWMDIKDERGRQKVHTVEFNPQNTGLQLRAGTKNGKVYGMQGVTGMATYADAPGNRVIAGINGDFYEISGYATGVPNGLFMDEGVILNSGGSYAFGLKADGTSIYGQPELSMSVTGNGKTTPLNSINRYRNTDQLVLYTKDYNSSTKSTADGDEIVLDIAEGEVKSGQTLKLKVSEVRTSQGDTPLAQGKVVLSAHGASRSVLQGLAPGDEVTAAFALKGEWKDVALAIGGQGPLIKDGVVQTGVGPAGVHPRTAIGTKADGSVVLFEIDGRSPGFSEGVETEELAKILKDLGVVYAMNLDGGGSSTFVARMPGTNGVKLLNQGSDGFERQTGNGLLLVNTAPELTVASKLAIQPNAERILKGSSFTFTAAGMDENGHPAAYTGALNWQVDPVLGTINEQGVFTAGSTAGVGKISAGAGNAQGEGEIEVVETLTELEFPDEIKTYTSGQSAQLSVKALRGGQTIQADNHSFEWRVEGEIGTVDKNGWFQASNENGKNGRIYVKYGSVETSFEVNVGLPPVMLENFEAGIDKYKAASAAANSVTLEEVTDQDFIRSGDRALKLEYDFIGKTGTSGAYVAATSTENRIQIPGYPEKISMWIYGDGQKHWLRGQIRDGNNAAVPVDYTDQVNGVNWTGWKYVEVAVPKGKTTPLSMDMPVRYMETSNLKKTKGAIYVDDIRALYGPLEEDQTPPVIKNEYPGANEMVKTATPALSVNGEDAGYDPVAHPGTTLIDASKVRLFIDDQLVEHGFYPPKGQITYKPKLPLAEGRHKVKLAIRDLSGNQTIKEWYFTVNLGSPFYKYVTPEVVYAGNTYTVDITAEKADKLKEGSVAFAFDPAAVRDLKVIAGSKLTEGQLEPVIDAAKGTVLLKLNRIHEAGLEDSDLLGQIQYTVRNDYIGPYTLEQLGGQLSKPLTIENTSGSVTSTEGSGTAISFIGASLESTVMTQLKLAWNHYEIAKGLAASFSVSEMEGGAAFQGAKLLIDGVEAEGVSGADGLLTTKSATVAEGTFKLQAVKGNAYSPVMTFKVAPYDGTAAPRNINVTMGEDADTSRRFAWQTQPQTEGSVVELVKQAEFTGFEDSKVLRIEGASTIYNSNNDGTMRVHKAEAANLEPGTAYVYRVGDGAANVSAQGTFVTSGGDREATKFLFIGDSQADSQAGFELWKNTAQQAFQYMPDAEMLVHAGDMVDKGFEQEQWNWWFGAAQEQLMHTSLVPIIGNHEVMGTNGDGDYLAQFNNPQNGAAGVKGTNFSFDIKDTHFVVMNTEHGEAEYKEQAQWLDQDLSATDKKWKIIFFHQGPYGSIYANERVQQVWVPVFDKHKVDLVMNGHDHIYMRSYPMNGGQRVAEGEGTRYVIGGSSGPKFYALTERFWQEKIYDEDEQIFTAVEIKNDGITVTARTVDGQEIDQLVIAKVAPESVTLDRTEALLEPGQSMQLHAQVLPANASKVKIHWSVVSEQPENTVTVNTYGLVTALKPGTAVVRAAVEGYPAIYAESKIDVDALESLSLQGKQVLRAGDTDQTVTEAVYASGKRIAVVEGLSYSSQNTDVATVDDRGQVEAHAVGSTVISVTYRELAAQYKLTVSTDGTPVMTGLEIEGPETLEQGSKGVAVVQAVYSDGSLVKLAKGVLFETSDPKVAEISESGEIHALSAGTVKVRGEYNGMSAEYGLVVTAAGQEPTPVPTPIPTPTPTPTPSSPPAPGAVISPAPSPTAAATLEPGVVEIAAARLSGERNAQGEVVITADPAWTELILPGNAGELLGKAPLRIQSAGLSVVIPAGVLAELSSKVPEGAIPGSTISLAAEAVGSDTAQAMITRAAQMSGARLEAASEVREWKLSLTTKQGQEFVLSQFAQPVTIAYEAIPQGNKELLGIYYIGEDGALKYAGGRWTEGRLSTAVSHFSKYAVLQYDKSFSDLPAEHWATGAVKQLSAKQLVQGVSRERFDPNRAVTRAEFTAMLVRSLGLSGHTATGFADVQPDKWYAEAISAAQQAGIVNGLSGSAFGPEAEITRQEMAVMLIRAYRYAAETQVTTVSTAAAFADTADAPQWAKTAIEEAVRLGLLQGRAAGRFEPKQNGTRAESAQMIVNLLQYMK